METPNNLAVLIRFGLNQLSSRNAHHEFEHLCRHLARNRICSNIIPATGPVSSGGDQGRDFETFRSHLESSELNTSSFIGKISKGPIAFACTIQAHSPKKPLKTKIAKDIETISKSGVKVHEIHYFAAEDLPVAKRHELQSWCKKEKLIDLEIYDGQAISEMLCDRDIFWIASEFLAVPSQLYSNENSPANANYESIKDNWSSKEIDNTSFSQFQELRHILRHATWDESVKQDLPFWIELTERYVSNDYSRILKRLATYEVAVSRLRGLGTLEGYEDRLANYFDGYKPVKSIGQLDDTVTLLSYCVTAQLMNLVHFDLDSISRWHNSLIEYVDNELISEQFESNKAYLLQIRGMLSLHNVTSNDIKVDKFGPMDWYVKLVDLLPEAKLFPVERFADCITRVCKYLNEHPMYEYIAEKTDQELQDRLGGFAVAKKSQERAFALYEDEKPIKAIKEIHRAKINWFSAETLSSSVRSLLILARWYSNLGLNIAGKYHALAACYICTHNDNLDLKPLSVEAAIEASHCDYSIGASAGFFDLVHLAKHLHTVFDVPMELEEESSLEAVILHTAVTVHFSKMLGSPAAELLEKRAMYLGLGKEYQSCLDAIEETYENYSRDDLLEIISDQLQGIPTSDLGPLRFITWHALGTEWNVEWQNTYKSNMFAEEFIATLQIVQSELAGKDLSIPSVQIKFLFKVSSVQKPEFTPIRSENTLAWELIWPENHLNLDKEIAFGHTLSAVVVALGSASLADENDLILLVEDLFKGGTASRMVVARSYGSLYSSLIDENTFNDSRRVFLGSDHPGLQRLAVQENQDLNQKIGFGKEYSPEASKDAIRNRYENISEALPNTLQVLSTDAGFIQTVRTLQDRGWKDWHILMAIYNTALNAYARKEYGSKITNKKLQEHAQSFAKSPGQYDSQPLSPTDFSLAQLEFHRKSSLGAILHSWGLSINHPSCSIEVLEKFLSEKYRYWDDDVEHHQIFKTS